MSAESLDIEPEAVWLELPLEPPSRRDEGERRQVDVDLDDDDPPPGVIVIELV